MSTTFQENPSEEDAAVVDKIMSSRTIKKEVMIYSFSLIIKPQVVSQSKIWIIYHHKCSPPNIIHEIAQRRY